MPEVPIIFEIDPDAEPADGLVEAMAAVLVDICTKDRVVATEAADSDSH